MTKKILAFLLCTAILFGSTMVFAETNRSITIENADPVLYIGKQMKLNAVVTNLAETAPKQTALNWSSSDPAIAAVNGAGFVRGVAAGKAVITAAARDDEDVKASVEIEVRVPVQAVTINEKNPSVVVGSSVEAATIQLTVTVKPENAYHQTGTWSSSNEAVAVVDQNGLVTGKSTGRALITFTSDDPSGQKKSQVNLGVGQAVQSITLSGNEGNLPKGRTLALKASVAPANATNKRVTWRSEDESVATVNAIGLVKGIAPGTTTITAIAQDGSGVEAKYVVTVVSPVRTIKTSVNRIPLAPDTEWPVTATVEPEDATVKDIIWTSSDESIVTVTQDGTVRGIKKGRATITVAAMDGSGVKMNIPVTVKNYDIVITTSAGANVEVDVPNGIWGVGFRSKTHCVTSESERLKPLKAGEDTFTVLMQSYMTGKVRRTKYSVLVTPSAVK